MTTTIKKPKSKHRRNRSRVQLQRQATVRTGPESLNLEERSVRAVIATDTPVREYDWRSDEEYDEILIPSGMVSPRKMRLRVDHRRYDSKSVIGVVTDFAIKKKTIEATLRFSRAADVAPIFERVADGTLDEVSIGATYDIKDTIRVEPGESYVLDGVTYRAKKVALRLVQIWYPSETSVVDHGADPKAVIRSRTKTRTEHGTNKNKNVNSKNRNRESASTQTENPMATRSTRTKPTEQNPADAQPKRVKRVKRSANEQTTAPDERKQRIRQQVQDSLKLTGAASIAPKTVTDDANEVARSERRRERARVARIMELAGDQIPKQLVERAIEKGWSPKHAGTQFFLHLQRNGDRPAKQTGDGVRSAPAGHVAGGVSLEALQASVLLRAGFQLDHPAFASEAAAIVFRRNKLDWLHDFARGIKDGGKSDLQRHIDVGRRFQNDSASRTCERILQLTGKRHSEDVEEMVHRSFSVSHMPRVFGALVSVGIIQGYAEYMDSTIGWTGTADWGDFRVNQPIGVDSTRGMRKHTRGTQAKDVAFTDYGEPYALARYTGKFTIDDMDIIDDQIGANQELPREMGRMAARLRPDLVYSLLLSNPTLSDNLTLFHTDRGNAIVSTPVSVEGMTKAETALALQVVPQLNGVGRPLNATMTRIIVPRSERANAKRATASTKVVTGSAITIGDLNPHEGEYQVHSDARLDLGVENPLTEIKVAGSTDFWYGADESASPTIQVGYRRGTGRAPQLRQYLLTQGSWGVGWDIAHDIAAGIIKSRGMVRCKITA